MLRSKSGRAGLYSTSYLHFNLFPHTQKSFLGRGNNFRELAPHFKVLLWAHDKLWITSAKWKRSSKTLVLCWASVIFKHVRKIQRATPSWPPQLPLPYPNSQRSSKVTEDTYNPDSWLGIPFYFQASTRRWPHILPVIYNGCQTFNRCVRLNIPLYKYIDSYTHLFEYLIPRWKNCLGRVSRCDFVGEMCHWRWALSFHKSIPFPVRDLFAPTGTQGM